MDSYDKTYLDLDELAKKIEARIKELEKQEEQEIFAKEVELQNDYIDKKMEKNITDLDKIIKEIDERIAEFEQEEKKEELDIVDLTDKINKKLEKLDDVIEEDLGKTRYDLSAISDAINDTIKKLEEKKKRKKELKAKYCELARRKGNKKCYKK